MASGVSAELALLYHGLGFSLIPLPLGTKVPTIAWKPYQVARATPEQICAWCTTPTNIGIVTGRISGLVVLDADDEAAARYLTTHCAYTPWQVQTARGWQGYYRHGGGFVGNKAGLTTHQQRIKIDVRGDGGFVVAGGSLHPSGARYELCGDWDAPPAAVPVYDPAWLVSPPAPIAARPTRPYMSSMPVLDRARAYLASVPRPEIGMGSDVASLYAACKLVRGFALPEADAVVLLDEWAGGRPGWDSRWLATKVQHALKYGTEPIGGLL